MKLLSSILILAVAACDRSPSKLDAVSPPAPALAAPPARAASPLAANPPADLESRLARIERRIDKVAGVLDQALGPNQPDPAATYAVPIGEHDPIEGPRDAKVTIVEGYEFLCPYCFLAEPAVQQILAKYPSDVRVVSKYLVIHGAPAASIGTYACAAAKQGKFAPLKAALWSHLFKLEGDAPRVQQDQIANLDAIATSVGLDLDKLKADAETCKAWLSSSRDELATVGVNGTPTFFINGRPVRDRSFAGLEKVVREELAKVSASSVAPADYYDRVVMASGLKQPRGRFDD